jgi:hypothetical protein
VSITGGGAGQGASASAGPRAEPYFLHDVPAEVLAAGEAHDYREADIAFGQPCAIDRWPDVPTRMAAGRNDRLFPLEVQRRVARERLGTDVDVVPGGHGSGPGPKRQPPASLHHGRIAGSGIIDPHLTQPSVAI